MKKLLLLLLVLVVGCSGVSKKEYNQDYTLLGLNWFQTAGEVKALQYQAFNIAMMELHKSLKRKISKKRAIVVDVDETVVDNSPYQASNIANNTSYPTMWKEWVGMAKARAIPGAVEFLNYATKKGVDVYYITNRKIVNFDTTYKNLKELGFPVIRERMLLRTAKSDKTKRRDIVLVDHEIIILMGDNLGDFSQLFQIDSYKERFSIVDKFKNEFGKKFIVLPNPMYGHWEGALDKDYFRKSKKEQSLIRKSVLRKM